MLMITPEAMKLFRGALASAEERQRRKRIEERQAKAKPPKLSQLQHESFLQKAIAVLRRYTASKFEYEGELRHGIRSWLCLRGWRWQQADAVAAQIVEQALNSIGAVRPRWIEGQHEHTHESFYARTRCACCFGPIPLERREGPHGYSLRYCSQRCNDVEGLRARSDPYRKRTWDQMLQDLADKRELRRLTHMRECATCGATFESRRSDAKYCGQACSKQALIYLRPRQCETCGAEFKPANGGEKLGRYCSNECSGLARRRADLERSCPVCFTGFRLRSISDRRKFCSLPCSVTARRLGVVGIVCEAVP